MVPTYPSTLILVKNWDRTKREEMFAKSPGLRHFLADDRTPAVEQLLPILPMGIS